MFKDETFMVVIPARGGSKGIPHKNIIDVCGKPLIAYTIEAAKQSKYIDKIIVSTDDIEIKNVSLKYGAEVPYLRPKQISKDDSKSIDVILHTIDYFENNGERYDYIILLQPTSPLRTHLDIDIAIEKIINEAAHSLVSVCEVSENPVLMRIISENKLQPIVSFNGSNLRRQELPIFYKFNGAIYINSVEMLLGEKQFVNEDTVPFIMEQDKSTDIDNLLDLKLVEAILQQNSNK